LSARADLGALELALTSPRPASDHTLRGYLQEARSFLAWLGHPGPATEQELRRYFLARRESGVGPNAIRYTHYALKKLFQANGWPYPFKERDFPPGPERPFQPALTLEEVRALVQRRDLYTPRQRALLALATTYLLRGEEFTRMRPGDFTGEYFLKRTSKGGVRRRHLVPPEIRPHLEGWEVQPVPHSTASLDFKEILKKAGVGEKEGYGWHSIRRTLETELLKVLDDFTVWSFGGWKKEARARRQGVPPILGTYHTPQDLEEDRRVFRVHPFLPFWAG